MIGRLNEIQGQTQSTTGRDRKSHESQGIMGDLCTVRKVGEDL